MKMLYQNTTKYTKKTYLEFLKFHNDYFQIYKWSFNFFISLVFLFCIYLQIQYQNWGLLVLFIFLFIDFILWRTIRPKQITKKELQSDIIKKAKSFTFTFFKDHFVISDSKEDYEIEYFKLYKVFETDDYFYLYTDKKHSYILEKNNFTYSNSQSFALFMKNQCRYKYKKVPAYN